MLDRLADADHPFPDLARATNQVLWSATWGKWLSNPMQWVDTGAPLISFDDVGANRDWFEQWVRSEGPLATLRVGRQPYGVLPAHIFDEAPEAGRWSTRSDTMARLYHHWFGPGNLTEPPVLDPDAADVAPGEEEAEAASDVGAILGATPNIGSLRLREAEDGHAQESGALAWRLGLAVLYLQIVPDRDGNTVPPDELPDTTWYAAYLEREDDILGANGIEGQQEAIDDLIDTLEGYTPSRGYTDEQLDAIGLAADYLSDAVVPTLDRHRDRVKPYGGSAIWELLEDLGAESALGSDRAPLLTGASYGDEGSEEPVEVLVGSTDDDAVAELADWLATQATAAADFADGGDRPSFDRDEPQPLFHQLIGSTLGVAGQEAAGAVADGLDRLAREVSDRGADAIPDLERLLRATLGLAIYRLDAWITSHATERVGANRVEQATGLQVGCFGWLVDLKQRRGPASQGHIHAPSLDHATTAAVLRSGWNAFGTDEEGGPLTIDVSSARIRAATSLIEGVRSGQELGRLLGGRFERRLHDAGLDRHIDDVRDAVLAGAGSRRPPTRVVDGLLLARAFTQGIEHTPDEEAVYGSVNRAIGSQAGVLAAIDETVADLDAVADLLVAQSVHALCRGDSATASSSLAATGSGDSGLPPIDFPRSAATGADVIMRVGGLLPESGGTAAWPTSTSLLTVAEPRLDRWLGHLLGPAERFVLRVDVGSKVVAVDLDQLGLGPLDVVYGIDQVADLARSLVGVDDAVVIEGPAGREGLDDGEISYDELRTLAGAAAQALASIRPLRHSDLIDPFGSGAGLDPAAADHDDGVDLTELIKRLDQLVTLVPDEDPRHEQLAKHRTDNPAITTDLVVERIQLMAGVPVPVLPVLTDGLPDELRQSFDRRARQGANVVPVTTWLAQAGRARRRLGTMVELIELSEMSQDRQVLGLGIGQWPDEGGEWVGTAAPTDGRRSAGWCSLGPVPEPGPLVGFVADAWTEVVPRTDTTSGIAVHFDRPSAVAPNAVLLAVSRSGEDFALTNVMRTLRGTLDLAQLRALGPDDPKFAMGQYLPAAMLEDDVVLATAESTNGSEATP